MHRYIVSFQRRSIYRSIAKKLFPIHRTNIIIYLATVLTAVIINIPTLSSSCDMILCEDEIEYGVLHKQYPRLSFERYMTIRISCYLYSHKNRVPVAYMCAIGNNESDMTDNAVSATGDYGFFQINAYHQYRGKDPNDLFDFSLNCKLAVNYYSQCYDRMLEKYGSEKELAQSFRFYNAGMSSDIATYNNWDYVINIMDDIQESRFALQEARDNVRLAANF